MSGPAVGYPVKGKVIQEKWKKTEGGERYNFITKRLKNATIIVITQSKSGNLRPLPIMRVRSITKGIISWIPKGHIIWI